MYLNSQLFTCWKKRVREFALPKTPRVMAISRLRCFPVAKVRVHDHKCYIHAAVSGRVITGGVNPADLRIWRELLLRRGKV